MPIEQHTSMIATLGGQPQVVTFALDILLASGEDIDDLYLLHPDENNPRLRESLNKLVHEFRHSGYAAAGRRLHLHPIKNPRSGAGVYDVRTAEDAEHVGNTIRMLIADLKAQGHVLHLCVAGGRRMMALLTVSAAALLCDHRDRVWHLYTPDGLRNAADRGAIMHADPDDGVQLISVPLVPWGAYFPALRETAQYSHQSIDRQMHYLNVSDQLQCKEVYNQLTPRQRDTLSAFAGGLRPREAAERLMISISTVNTHKTKILEECRIAWDIDETEQLDYRFLRERFAHFMHQLAEHTG